jgi:Mg-chelatase subunit ChlD
LPSRSILKKNAAEAAERVELSNSRKVVNEITRARLNTARVLQLDRRRQLYARAAAGRRLEAVASRKRGKYARHRLDSHGRPDVALDATLRAAAARQAGCRSSRLQVAPEDLRHKIRRHRSP